MAIANADRVAVLVVTGCAVVSALVATEVLDPARTSWFVASLAAVGLATLFTGLAAYRRSGSSLRSLMISPFSIAAATWVILFVLRPLELYVFPEHAADSVAQLGFQLGDLSRTVAIAGLGCAAWCGGYLLTLGRVREPTARARRLDPLPLSGRAAVGVLAVGTILWGALFIRQGGPSALIHAPASIRANQGSSFYAFVGVWLVQGTALYAFAALLRHPTRTTKLVLAAAVVLTLAATISLQARGLAGFTALAALVIYLGLRAPTRRKIVVGLVALAAAVLLLAATVQFRNYTQFTSTREAIELTAETPLWVMLISDLSTYDNFAAIQEVVPDSIPYLEGETLIEIPTALVPRSLWPEKPLGLDFLVSSYFYPGATAAVPISMQGEFYWNGGLAVVAVGAFLVGLLMGGLGRVGLRTTPGSAAAVLYAVAFTFTHAFLTRGLATMTGNLTLALIGVGLAIGFVSPPARRAVVHTLSERSRQLRSLAARPVAGP